MIVRIAIHLTLEELLRIDAAIQTLGMLPDERVAELETELSVIMATGARLEGQQAWDLNAFSPHARAQAVSPQAMTNERGGGYGIEILQDGRWVLTTLKHHWEAVVADPGKFSAPPMGPSLAVRAAHYLRDAEAGLATLKAVCDLAEDMECRVPFRNTR